MESFSLRRKARFFALKNLVAMSAQIFSYDRTILQQEYVDYLLWPDDI